MATVGLKAFALVVSLASFTPSTVADVCSPLPYEIYWNVAEANPNGVNLSQFLIFPANYTQTGDGCSTQGCQSWSQGLFPTITETGKPINGGVPQNTNLTAHLQKLKETVVTWIPDPEWNGNAVLDFEAWTTVWELNYASGNWHSYQYVNYSVYLEKLMHPDWDEVEIMLEAKKNFEAAATNFFTETLNTLKMLRPKAKWGFYGLPMNFNEPCVGNGKDMECGYNSPLGDLFRQFSDQQIPIWEASTALYPSIYLPPFRTADENAAYVRSVVNETLRCANGKIPVYAFHWNYYHNGTTLLSPEDLLTGLLGSYDVGAQGVVMWGSATELNNSTFVKYVEEKVGPLAQKFIEDMCECSKKYCSGHGRCMPSSATTCQCYPGYSGPQCQNSSP